MMANRESDGKEHRNLNGSWAYITASSGLGLLVHRERPRL